MYSMPPMRLDPEAYTSLRKAGIVGICSRLTSAETAKFDQTPSGPLFLGDEGGWDIATNDMDASTDGVSSF